MYNHKHCPKCDTRATRVVDTQFHATVIERVRVCEDCPTQYTVEYGMPEITNTTQVE